jgi:glycerol dehydrogenase
LAHALNNALTQFEIIEKEHLHGEVVAFGVLVLCTIDAQDELIKRLRPFYEAIGLPVKLSQLGLQPNKGLLGNLLSDTVSGEEMRFGAYQVDEEQLFWALTTLESV